MRLSIGHRYIVEGSTIFSGMKTHMDIRSIIKPLGFTEPVRFDLEEKPVVITGARITFDLNVHVVTQEVDLLPLSSRKSPVSITPHNSTPTRAIIHLDKLQPPINLGSLTLVVSSRKDPPVQVWVTAIP